MGDRAALGNALHMEPVEKPIAGTNRIEVTGYDLGAHPIPRGPEGNPEAYLRKFKADQQTIGGTPEQLAVLADVRAGKYEHTAHPTTRESAAVLAHIPDEQYGTLANRNAILQRQERDAASRAQPGPVDKDQATVILNGQEKARGGVRINGEVTDVEQRDGLTTIRYNTGGRLNTLTFADPMGKDAAGQPVRHPLHQVSADVGRGDGLDLKIDATGKNVAVRVEEGNFAREQRIGPEAAKVFGPAAKTLDRPRGSPALEEAMRVETVDERGYHIGNHVIPYGSRRNPEEYLDQFRSQQIALGGTPKQIETLTQLRDGATAALAHSEDPAVRKTLAAVPDGLYGNADAAMRHLEARLDHPRSGSPGEPAIDPHQMTVTLNGQDKARGGVSLSGKVTGVEHDAGITSIQYEVGGRLQTLAFSDPMGNNAAGDPIAHPLAHLAQDLGKGDKIDLRIDPSGQNAAYKVAHEDGIAYENRVGPQAHAIYGAPSKQVLPAGYEL
jgi:hypothetical protein